MSLELLLRWLHIFSAIVLAGGLFFTRCALWPALNRLPIASADEIRQLVRGYWARVVMITSGLLLITGIVNAVTNIRKYELPGVYHGLVSVKLLFGLVIFWLAAAISGKSDGAKRIRQNEVFWLNGTLVLVAVVVCIAGYMKLTPRQPKNENINAPVALESGMTRR
jgi:uncharacterized membrane protein